ncbi:MAG: FAD-dependent monooxygenase [Armatimonadota bacterium]
MRIAVIGGGPGGLFFSILMKRVDPRHAITVFERNAPDATFGFGVVFPERSLRYLREADQETHERFIASCVAWEDIAYHHRGRTLRFGGHAFSGIARTELLRILQERAGGLGVDLRFAHEAGDLAAFADYDLLVAADGANSLVRREMAAEFRSSVQSGRSKFIWLGTTKIFDALTFLFEESRHGWFGVHAYPYSTGASTFIVETDEATWHRAGFERYVEAAMAPGASDLESLAYCQALFARHLDGHPLLANNSKWLNFRTIRNRLWHAKNAVILGDAAHTAHFSVGSGTRLAIEDAIALAQGLADHTDLEAALTAYERERQPAVRRIQQAAEPSRRWWESFRYWTHFGPEQFAFHHLARTRSLTYGTLKVRDARAVGEVETWFARSNGAAARATGRHAATGRPATVSPLMTPLRLRDVRFPNRLVAVAAGVLDDREELPNGMGTVGSRTRTGGAGLTLVMSRHAEVGGRSRPKTRGRVGLYLRGDATDGSSGDSTAACLRLARGAARAGVDLLAVGCTPSQPALATLAAVRKAWPARRPLCAHIAAWGDPENDRLVEAGLEFVRALKACGCDVVAVSGPAGPAREPERARVAQIHTSDLIRNVVGIPTMIIGGLYSVGDLTALLLAGRTDMCGWPRLAWPEWQPGPSRAARRRPGEDRQASKA